ncbi:hypothetical protein SKAU_G00136140 [Synaphobranchus kaupii]|uniref:Uncharacterized protein n=1 Tax=Synaphobranchus kaupii TaxID=118154 RepID=A0A9Q1FRK2_SYNKA|nr:hypothetical protein SKAU_G00136140 [Synaphobranchus kaupii]
MERLHVSNSALTCYHGNPLLALRARRGELCDVRLSVVTETRRASACFIDEKRLNAAAELSESWVTFWGLPITDFNRKTLGKWQNERVSSVMVIHNTAKTARRGVHLSFGRFDAGFENKTF